MLLKNVILFVIFAALETMYQIHPRPEPFGPSGIRPELPPSPPSGLHDAGPDPVPEYETNFVPSRQAPHYVQQFQHLHPKLTKVQRHVQQDKPPAGGQPVRQDPQQVSSIHPRARVGFSK